MFRKQLENYECWKREFESLVFMFSSRGNWVLEEFPSGWWYALLKWPSRCTVAGGHLRHSPSNEKAAWLRSPMMKAFLFQLSVRSLPWVAGFSFVSWGGFFKCVPSKWFHRWHASVVQLFVRDNVPRYGWGDSGGRRCWVWGLLYHEDVWVSGCPGHIVELSLLRQRRGFWGVWNWVYWWCAKNTCPVRGAESVEAEIPQMSAGVEARAASSPSVGCLPHSILLWWPWV